MAIRARRMRTERMDKADVHLSDRIGFTTTGERSGVTREHNGARQVEARKPEGVNWGEGHPLTH